MMAHEQHDHSNDVPDPLKRTDAIRHTAAHAPHREVNRPIAAEDAREDTSSPGPPSATTPTTDADQVVDKLTSLLRELESAADSSDDTVDASALALSRLREAQKCQPVVDPSSQSVVDSIADNELAIVRLGAAAALFAALRFKNAASAAHALRVSLTCSAWADATDLPDNQRNAIEVAALLHDVGVIGVPDHILLKPKALDTDEASIMTRARQMSLEILRHAGASDEVIDIVRYLPAWYNGDRSPGGATGQAIPLGARMIAIAEAFDAMTVGRVYREAMSQERAAAELFACSGIQFDPRLVESFVETALGNLRTTHEAAARRWLKRLDGDAPQAFGLAATGKSRTAAPTESPIGSPDGTAFEAKLLENMYDAVMFIDDKSRITLWNRGAERLTGIASVNVLGHRWHPTLLELHDERSKPISGEDCPVSGALTSGVQALRRLSVVGRMGKHVAVDAHAIPVSDPGGETIGAILLFHDATSVTSLERRCQNLRDRATRDPLTQVANRAEFDRVLAGFVEAHQQNAVPCALIILDVDRFKLVNDTFGHQAGDDVLVSLGALLRDSCRAGDLVARYGGEEFVLLCADCNNATAASRAEQLRATLERISQPRMGGKTVSASFGVTEIQAGDTPETMLRRADRALLMAKEGGRNRVIQLGVGTDRDYDRAIEASGSTLRRGIFTLFGLLKRKDNPIANVLVQRNLITPVPVKMTLEKLRGFVADHQAVMEMSGDRDLQLIVDSGRANSGEQQITFVLDVHLEERVESIQKGDETRLGSAKTAIFVSLRPKHRKDSRRPDLAQCGTDLLSSLRAYLMAYFDGEAGGGSPKQKQVLSPWG